MHVALDLSSLGVIDLRTIGVWQDMIGQITRPKEREPLSRHPPSFSYFPFHTHKRRSERLKAKVANSLVCRIVLSFAIHPYYGAHTLVSLSSNRFRACLIVHTRLGLKVPVPFFRFFFFIPEIPSYFQSRCWSLSPLSLVFD